MQHYFKLQKYHATQAEGFLSTNGMFLTLWVQLVIFIDLHSTELIKMEIVSIEWNEWTIAGFIWARVASQPFLIVLYGLFCSQ